MPKLLNEGTLQALDEINMSYAVIVAGKIKHLKTFQEDMINLAAENNVDLVYHKLSNNKMYIRNGED